MKHRSSKIQLRDFEFLILKGISVHPSSLEVILVLLESLCAFLGNGEQKVADGMDGLDG